MGALLFSSDVATVGRTWAADPWGKRQRKSELDALPLARHSQEGLPLAWAISAFCTAPSFVQNHWDRGGLGRLCSSDPRVGRRGRVRRQREDVVVVMEGNGLGQRDGWDSIVQDRVTG